MNLLKIIIYIFISIYLLSLGYADAAINYTLTPLKYDIEVAPWDVINRSAQIRNNGPDTVILTTATSDFQANWTNGTPTFVRYSELVNPDQQLSSWVNIDQESIALASWETWAITFSITVPENATPWGHYAAVFFKNPDWPNSWWAQIGITVDYWVLLIVNVEWDIITDIEIDPIVISPSRGSSSSSGGTGWNRGSSSWSSSWSSNESEFNEPPSSKYTKDSCPFWDLTNSNFDGKCIDNFLKPSSDWDSNWEDWQEWEWNTNWENWESDTTSENWDWEGVSESWNKNPTTTTETKDTDTPEEKNDFEINFQLPINNNWNSHIEPDWKIRLIDEDGKEIKAIGREVKRNEYGAVIWEDIVDYLPLNDEWWKVLPDTKRIFETSWKWFPYKEYNDRGDQIIKYRDPWEYYTNENIADNQFLMPWERVNEELKTKTVKAYIEIAYKDGEGDDIQYNSAGEFEIEYTQQYIWLNPYVIIPLFLFAWLFLLFWIIIAKRKKRCSNSDCEEKIKRSARICPYCDTKQKRSKKTAIAAWIKREKKKKKDDTSKKKKNKKS